MKIILKGFDLMTKQEVKNDTLLDYDSIIRDISLDINNHRDYLYDIIKIKCGKDKELYLSYKHLIQREVYLAKRVYNDRYRYLRSKGIFDDNKPSELFDDNHHELLAYLNNRKELKSEWVVSLFGDNSYASYNCNGSLLGTDYFEFNLDYPEDKSDYYGRLRYLIDNLRDYMQGMDDIEQELKPNNVIPKILNGLYSSNTSINDPYLVSGSMQALLKQSDKWDNLTESSNPYVYHEYF